MQIKGLSCLAVSLALATLMADHFPNLPTAASEQPARVSRDGNLAPANLVALLYLRRDNLKNELGAEVYPIAFLFNGKYVDASVDITQDPDFPAVVEIAKQKSLLNAIQQFKVINQGRKLGKFVVNHISPGQFQCSEILTGKGQSAEHLSNLFNTLSPQYLDRTKGYIRGKEFDETIKSAIALSNYHSTPSVLPKITKQQQDQYREDLLAIAKPLLAKSQPDKTSQNPRTDLVLDETAIVDLDRDGRPEVFGKLHKPVQAQEPEQTVYRSLWLTYKNNQPQVIADLASTQEPGSWGTGYDLIGTTDITGDGTEEVLIRISGYEYQGFSIYEYRDNKLTSVFEGAGFGC